MPRATSVSHCVRCGAPLGADNQRATCSAECADAHRKARQRESYYRRVKQRPDLNVAAARRLRSRAASDQSVEERLRSYDAAKRAKHRERMATDPEYAARHRARATEHYRKRAAAIQAKRREKRNAWLASATPEEVVNARRAASVATIRSREKRQAEYAAYQRQTRRHRTKRALAVQLAKVGQSLSGRVDRPIKKKVCVQCGNPVVGRHPAAKTCSAECSLQRRRAIIAARWFRPRACVECGRAYTSATSTNTCSPECQQSRRQRKDRQRELARRVALGLPPPRVRRPAPSRQPIAQRDCVVCGREFLPTKRNGILCSPACRAEHKRQVMRAPEIAERRRNNKPIVMARCIVCGEEFQVCGPDRYTCSPQCKQEAMAQKNRRSYLARKEKQHVAPKE